MKKFLIISAVLFGVVSTENCFCMDDEDANVNVEESVAPVSGKWKLQMKAVIAREGVTEKKGGSKLARDLREFSKQVCVLEEKNKALEEAKIQQENELMASIESLNFEKSLLSKENSELKDKLAFVEQGMMELLAKIKQ